MSFYTASTLSGPTLFSEADIAVNDRGALRQHSVSRTCDGGTRAGEAVEQLEWRQAQRALPPRPGLWLS